MTSKHARSVGVVVDAVRLERVEAAVVDRAFLRVAGPEAEAYLQGQLSQDVSIGGGLSWLLDPNGKVVALLRFGRTADEFRIDTDPQVAEAVLARLRRFLLRTKAEIDPVDGLYLVRVFDGPARPQAEIVTAWPPGDAVQDVIVPDPAVELRDLGATLLEPLEYERRRILAGVPVSGVDVDADTIPAEAGRWTIESAVSFTKGCYTGQELVARIDSRGGNVPRPVRVLRFEGAVEAGAEVLDADGKVVGRITSAAGDVAMGPIARRVDPGAAVTAAGTPGRIDH
jgi:folate-binding protein YgfZ